jgi:hypothetical protein
VGFAGAGLAPGIAVVTNVKAEFGLNAVVDRA